MKMFWKFSKSAVWFLFKIGLLAVGGLAGGVLLLCLLIWGRSEDEVDWSEVQD